MTDNKHEPAVCSWTHNLDGPPTRVEMLITYKGAKVSEMVMLEVDEEGMPK